MYRDDIKLDYLFAINTPKMTRIDGIVIHNTAGGSSAAGHAQRVYNQTWNQREAGFTHYWVDNKNIYQSYDDEYVAWHTGNMEAGNKLYIGIEIVDGLSDSDFLEAEQKTFELAARLANEYNLPANCIRLHGEFSSTACPKRSADTHGGYDAVKAYFNAEVQRYRGNNAPQATPSPAPTNGDNWEIVPNVREWNYPLNNGMFETGYVLKGRDTNSRHLVWSGQKQYNPGMSTFVAVETTNWTPGGNNGKGNGSQIGYAKYKLVDRFLGEDGNWYNVQGEDLWIVSHVDNIDQFRIERK